MTGLDFVCHLIVVGLNFLVDPELLLDQLMTDSNFACHLMMVGLNFLVDSVNHYQMTSKIQTSHQMIDQQIRIHKEIQINHNQMTSKIRGFGLHC
jgi:hypothetical protein